MKYHLLVKSTGEQRTMVSSHDLKAYFTHIERLTGIDRVMAESIMVRKPIDHPGYRFWSTRI